MFEFARVWVKRAARGVRVGVQTVGARRARSVHLAYAVARLLLQECMPSLVGARNSSSRAAGTAALTAGRRLRRRGTPLVARLSRRSKVGGVACVWSRRRGVTRTRTRTRTRIEPPAAARAISHARISQMTTWLGQTVPLSPELTYELTANEAWTSVPRSCDLQGLSNHRALAHFSVRSGSWTRALLVAVGTWNNYGRAECCSSQVKSNQSE